MPRRFARGQYARFKVAVHLGTASFSVRERTAKGVKTFFDFGMHELVVGATMRHGSLTATASLGKVQLDDRWTANSVFREIL